MADFRAEFYRAYASTHTLPRKGPLTPERLRIKAAQWDQQFGPLLPKRRDVRILDGGCGDGALLWWLRAAGYSNSEGVEVGDEQVAAARALGLADVHQAELLEFIRTRAATYDVVILRNVLEHFDKSRILELLRLVHGSLVAGGSLVVQAPNAESPFFGRIRYGDFTHDIAFCSSSLAQVLAVCGFSNVEFHPVRTHFPGLRGWPRRMLWRLVEAGYCGLLTAELGRGNYVVTQDILARAEKH